MKRFCDMIVLLIVLLCNFELVLSDLTLDGVKCGDKRCKWGEYCSPFHTSCESCSKICNQSTHNFDGIQCVKSCQDYLHDNRYVLKNEANPDDGNLRATVQRLNSMITVTLVLVSFILIALAAVLSIQLYRWKKKKNITLATLREKFFSKKNDSTQNKTATIQNQETNVKPDLRLEISAESTHSGNSPVTLTTSISRRPAEDSTLDYAYDNPAMSSSPNNKTPPNSF